MSSPSRQVYRGSVKGTGSAINVDVVGFKPGKVTCHNTDGDEMHWQDTLPDAYGWLRIDSSGVGSLEVTNGITPRAGGFTIGANANINQSGKYIHYEAME